MIRVLAIDDEPLALQQLEAYIAKVPFLELVSACQSAVEAKKMLESDFVDAIFCDINMPDLSGMDFVRQLAAPPLIVFTTAYSEYAVDSYRVNAIDYLLKPFGFNDFLRAANKVKEQHELRNQTANVVADNDTLFVKSDYRVLKLSIADIKYVEGMSEYIKIHLLSQPKPIITHMAMKRLEELLPQHFMRIHRSYIVNLTKIEEVNKNRVMLADDVSLPIGELYKDAFLNYLNARIIGK